jgi:hypothetical protein
MKTKLEMAHEYALEMAKQGIPLKSCLELGWKYADAMQAEADKRNKAEAAQKRKEMREMLNAPNTFVEREGQHFDDVEGREVDWRVAPCWAKEWVMRNGAAKWECGAHADSWEDAPSFGFTGTHIVERPHGF